ncbi:helix-turn-helix domain-containing protein [Serratia odorifera]|jgi:AraC family transcriptional regulator, mar-sox-rob regulon activator|uniref:Transcriptional regulator, AraC family n=2 Tax=Serratia odorifera TaxID=618 RepID=D4DXL9_SEROD|nr:helix-turn-helix domain-containing protein [Serratia odorifera]EFE97762.1 transcriptional regulator, AraC family [Serratia odorifera DSM 4582]MBJ2065251.1 helix-turn-helix domain-containing protein [Serratia odorifera]PNK92146.1 AraC family transcriptional regulator [Serratia odorifera]RII73510.1 helix-turn-helix domain-containing protein [Serratia odorifera]VDZ53095.1 Right origin-binding protein [Serratia odorifera]
MHQLDVINQLLAWIEQNLDQPLTLDDIAARSGYSKWHLQRMFKQQTGHVLGTYARRRRLTAAARELRLMRTSVAIVADKYQFDSQQTFTRGFKKQFGLPPAAYRRCTDWSSYGMQPPLRIAAQPLPAADFVELPAMQLVGRTQRRTMTLHELGRMKKELRHTAWSTLLQPNAQPPSVAYGLTSLEVDGRQRDRQRMVYTAALVDERTVGEVVQIEPGEYASFVYHGQAEELQNFIARIYDTAMPELDVVRRPGRDIERFYPAQSGFYHQATSAIRCEYLIPIRRLSADKSAR